MENIKKDICRGSKIIEYINILDEKYREKFNFLNNSSFNDDIQDKMKTGKILRILRNNSVHNNNIKDEKNIEETLKKENHKLTNLTILLKYIIICEFLLELFNNGVKDENTREKKQRSCL